MKKNIFFRSLLFALTYIMLNGCGIEGSGIENSGIGTDGSGAPKSISSIGPIAELNANDLSVNDTKFDTSVSEFTIDGEPGEQSDLKVGQIIFVSGTLSEDEQVAVAETVIFETNVLGPINEIDLSIHRLIVMGQSVFVGSETVYNVENSELELMFENGFDLDDLAEGYVIRVSGQVNANGSINATYIGLVAINVNEPGVSDLLEVTGKIQALEPGGMMFQISELIIDYSGANVPSELDNATLVQVKGVLGDGGVFLASVIELVDVSLGLFGSAIELQGLVTGFTSTENFVVSGVDVITNANTLYQGGVIEDLELDRLVEIEGVINENQQIEADRVIFLDIGDVMILGISDPGLQIVNGQLVFNNGWATIRVNDSTYFEDNSSVRRAPLFLHDLQPNDLLEIWGRRSDSSSGELQLEATRIIRQDRDNPNSSDNRRSGIMARVESVDVNDAGKFQRFSVLNTMFTPCLSYCGDGFKYLNEEGMEITVDDPNILIGKQVKIRFRWQEDARIHEMGLVVTMQLSNATEESESVPSPVAEEVIIEGISEPELQIIGNQLIFSGGRATVIINESTQFSDESTVQQQPLLLNHLQPNDFLRIKGVRADTENKSLIIVATEITRQNLRYSWGARRHSGVFGVINSVVANPEKLLSFNMLNRKWYPCHGRCGGFVFYEDGPDGEARQITVDDPNTLIGRRVKAGYHHTEEGRVRLGGYGPIKYLYLLPSDS